METAICKTSVENTQDGDLNLDLKTEGISLSQSSFSSASASSVKAENSEINLKAKPTLSMSGLDRIDSEKPTSCESPKMFESQQKSLSPTLIEHAIKVMKNLFSPDKTRSKPSNIPSPILCRSRSGSPINSVYIPNKAEFCTPESGIEIKNIVQSAENSLKGEMGVMHNSFNIDPLNTTNDSFFTTVSLIDESFQSAITNLDENGETLKNDENLKENSVNDSRNFYLLDPLSESLENSRYCMENTILVNGSLNSDRAKSVSILSDGVKGSVKSQDCVQDTDSISNDSSYSNGLSKSCLNFFTFGDKNVKYPSVECPQFDFLLKNSGNEEAGKTKSEETENEAKVQMINFKEFEEPSQSVKSEEISPSQNFPESCHKTLKSNESLGLGEEKRENSDEHEMNLREEVIEIDGESAFEVLIKENSVEKSISTTTVILNSVDSVDIENMLLSLKEDDTGTNTSSFNSLEENDENGSCTLDHDGSTQPDIPSTEAGSALLNGDKQSLTESNFDNNFTSKKPSGRPTCKSEENSPTKLNSARKNKLNKSIDFVKRRSRSKSPKVKKPQRETLGSRSSGGISMLKNSEVSDNIPGFHSPTDILKIESTPEVRTILSPQSLNVQTNKIRQNSSQFEFGKSTVALDEQDDVSVVSQQSYTILSAHNKNLNRPVINSFENFNNGAPESDQISNSTYCKVPEVMGESNSGEQEVVYSSVSSNNLNLFPTSKPSTMTYEVKSNSKLSKGPQSGSTQTFVRPISLNLYSQEEPSGGDSGGDFNELREHSFQTKPDLNGEPPELSPVAPRGNQVLFPNEMNQTLEEKLKSSTPNRPNLSQKNPESPVPNKLNQTYEKKAGSPAPSKMNQTFDKKQETPVQNMLNRTYDTKTETPPTTNLNQTYEKKSEGSVANRMSQGNPESPTPRVFNETFEKKPDSPSILSQTFEVPNAGDQDEKNKTFEIKTSPQGGNVLDETFEKGKVQGGKSEPCFLNRISEETAQLAAVESPKTCLTSIAENIEEKSTDSMDLCLFKDALDVSFISTSSNASLSCNPNSTVMYNQAFKGSLAIDDLAAKVGELNLSETVKKGMDIEKWCAGVMPSQSKAELHLKDQTIFIDQKFPPPDKDEKLQCDAELAQLIQEQFSSTDIEKICSVVDDMSFLRLSNQKVNELSEKPSVAEFKPLGIDFKSAALTPQSFDFLNSIKGRPTGRDFSRESLYVKFDPLVQATNANSLIDFTKEVEALAASGPSPETDPGASLCEQLLAISPEKKPDDIVPPLTPLSHRKKEDKAERLKELQNEIYFFRNMYVEREKLNRARMDEFESQVAKLTGQNCMLEDKLKESHEREKSLVKKLNEETQSMNQLKTVMEEYLKMITKLTLQLQELKLENAKKVEILISEKDSYITHLQNTEAAFTDVHAKYEKSKKTILNLRANEAAYKSTIAEKSRLLEHLREKAKEAQEVTFKEFQKIQEELSDTKAEHRQETARLRAQLRKTELKLEAMQEALDHKIKENEQLTAICDELIEGKK